MYDFNFSLPINFAHKGERHVHAKLSRLDVQDIKSRYSTGQATQLRLAKEYGVSHVTIHRTEKVDGTNIRVMWDGHSVTFGGRTDKAQIPAHLVNKLNELFGGTNKEEIFEQKFGETPVALFGEGFGEKIQKGGGLYGPVNFILFDAIIGNMWLRPDSLKDIADSFGIQVVPQVGGGSLYDAVKFIKTHPKSKLRDAEMEGVVCRPLFELADRRGNRMIVKIKCRDFPLEGE